MADLNNINNNEELNVNQNTEEFNAETPAAEEDSGRIDPVGAGLIALAAVGTIVIVKKTVGVVKTVVNNIKAAKEDPEAVKEKRDGLKWFKKKSKKYVEENTEETPDEE